MAIKYNSFIRSIVTIAMLSVSTLSNALTLEQAQGMRGEEKFDYQQDSLQLQDPAGDLLLLRIITGTPWRLLMVKLGIMNMTNLAPPKLDEFEISKQCKPFEDNIAACPEGPISLFPKDMKFLEGRTNPIRRKEFGQMLAQVILEESRNGIPPVVGTPHTWSKEVMEKYNPGEDEHYGTLLAFSKVLLVLSHGLGHRFMFAPQEENLTKWLLEQPAKSVTHDKIFRQSYRLNRGNVYLTLLTIENILSRRWRFPNREELPMTKRLLPFTNFLANQAVDNFGSWYHLYGMMLYSYLSGESKAEWVAKIEHWGSKILDGDPEPQEFWINLNGAWLGADLRKIVETPSQITPLPSHVAFNSLRYLNREDFRDQLPVAQDPYLFLTKLNGGLQIENRGAKLDRCKLTVMADQGEGINSVNKWIQDEVTIPQGEKIFISPAQIATASKSNNSIRAAKVFFENCYDPTVAWDMQVPKSAELKR